MSLGRPGFGEWGFLWGSGSLRDLNTPHNASSTLALPAKSPGKPGTQFPRSWVSLDLAAHTEASQPPSCPRQSWLPADRPVLLLQEKELNVFR